METSGNRKRNISWILTGSNGKHRCLSTYGYILP